MHAKDKFIAYVDILGFTALVEAAEEDDKRDLSRAIELTKALGSAVDTQKFRDRGPATCPCSRYVARDLDFQVTQVSDCVVISAETSPAGIINLANHCFGIALAILYKGAQCRGFITRGNIFHRDGQFIGTGYVRAYNNEGLVAFMRANNTEKGTPFIQVDDVVTDYVRDETDDCVRMMFGRITRSDGTYSAIYPFAASGNVPAAFIGPDFNPNYWKASVQKSIGYRQANLAAFEEAEQHATQESVKLKIRHYKRGLEEVIQRLRAKESALDHMIATGRIPHGTVWR